MPVRLPPGCRGDEDTARIEAGTPGEFHQRRGHIGKRQCRQSRNPGNSLERHCRPVLHGIALLQVDRVDDDPVERRIREDTFGGGLVGEELAEHGAVDQAREPGRLVGGVADAEGRDLDQPGDAGLLHGGDDGGQRPLGERGVLGGTGDRRDHRIGAPDRRRQTDRIVDVTGDHRDPWKLLDRIGSSDIGDHLVSGGDGLAHRRRPDIAGGTQDRDLHAVPLPIDT